MTREIKDKPKVCVNAIISDQVKSHANDPFFVKKLADAKEALSKISLPASNKA